MKKQIELLKHDKKLPKFDDAPIRAVLAEAMPVLHRSLVGRMRLIRALTFKYGDNYKTFEAPTKALKHFDAEVAHLRTYIQTKRKYSDG